MKIEDVHVNLLSLLKIIDKICQEHEIKYSLFAGTLIGAVRHQGFIPWDDDADIVFERKEYEKFLKVIPFEYQIFRNSWVPRFSRKNGKGLFIDIFVFDSISDVYSSQKMQILKLKFLQGTLKGKLTSNRGVVGTLLAGFTLFIGKLFSTDMKIKWYDNIAQSMSLKVTNSIFSSLDQFKYIDHILPKSIVLDYNYAKFEDTEFMIMKGYDTYLTKFYGDYMKLPAEEKRKPEHGNV